MTNPNNWPGEPGYPLNPERMGAHMIRVHIGSPVGPMLWNATSSMWVSLSGQTWGPEFGGHNWQYLGPCISIGEQCAAGYAAGAADARKADVDWLEAERNRFADGNPHVWCALDASLHKVELLPLPQSKPSTTTENTQPDSGESKPDQMSVAIPEALTGDVQRERTRIAGIIQQMIDARRARAGMDIGVESIKAKDQIEFGETILRCLRGGVV